MSEPPVRLGPDGPDAHPRKTGHNRLDLALALSAIFISGVSLYVAIEHGQTERDLVAANSWPFLRPAISNDFNSDHDLEIGISNGGVGPAKVKSYQVFYQGAPVANPYDLLRKCCGLSSDPAAEKLQINNAFVTAVVDDQVLRPGEAIVAFQLRKQFGEPRLVDRFNETLRVLTYRACYCSVFDKCWTTTLMSTDVTAVRTCPAPKARFDPNGGR